MIATFLARQDPLILDGALATELERRGADLNDPLWSARVLLERPALIQATHLDYFRAGADVATTASYQATFEGFARRGLEAEKATALLRRAVELALAARAEFWSDRTNRLGRQRPLVAASIGPYGAMLADGSEYRGYAVAESVLRDFHRPRLRVLAAAGADLLACETIPCLAEARALARLLAEETSLGAWVSFSCRDSRHNCYGEPIAACAAELDAAPGVLAIGVNCTAPRHLASLIAEIRTATAKPIVVYPNSGERYEPSDKSWHGDGAGCSFVEAARTWHDAGARLIGGCCRTTPAVIRELRQALLPDPGGPR